MQRAAVALELPPENVAVVSGIGCSGKMSQHFGGYGLHSLHGRSLPTAQAVKLANKNLTVMATGGDGDGFGIGMGHFIHAMRRNVDITYIVMDNHIYGLTTGQASPTSDLGSTTKTSPHGTVEKPIEPLQLALSERCGFIAQGFSGDTKHLAQLIERAISHRGFSFVNVFSPCVTFNKVNTYESYKGGLVNLDEDETYDKTDRFTAMRRVSEADNQVVGVVYEETEHPAFDETVYAFPDDPLVTLDRGLQSEEYHRILAGFR
jgi:2-oxoglutarate ferredoxin oxidoreductase subunit beta